jgi:hypothetical protein
MHASAQCPHCEKTLEFQRFHSGFGDQGYMYCDRDETVVTWSWFDPVYKSLVGLSAPWQLTDAQKDTIERALLSCPCGGQFRYSSLPRCPHCNGELSELEPELRNGSIYFAVFGRWVDGESSSVWAGAKSQ